MMLNASFFVDNQKWSKVSDKRRSDYLMIVTSLCKDLI